MSLRQGDAVIPMEVYMDRRLTLIQVRVLCALYSFHNTKTGAVVFPKRDQLAKRCGYTVQNISKATKQLSGFGWITKKGSGGFSKPVEYRLHAPDITVSELDTVSGSNTVSEPDTSTVSGSDTTGVSGSDTGNKQSIKQSIEQSNNILGKFHFDGWPEKPSKEVFKDWLAMRKKQKATVSQTVINRLAKQITIANQQGMSADDCLSECVLRNWRGFEYSWVQKNTQSMGGRVIDHQGTAIDASAVTKNYAQNCAVLDEVFGNA